MLAHANEMQKLQMDGESQVLRGVISSKRKDTIFPLFFCIFMCFFFLLRFFGPTKFGLVQCAN